MSGKHPEGEITQLLAAWQGGDGAALDRLVPLIYEQLRFLARRQQAKGASDTLQTTAVVHEAYLKLAGSEGQDFVDRGHFYAVASRAMRQVLVDHARRKSAQKRGGDRARIEPTEGSFAVEDRAEQVLAVDEALTRLDRLDPRLARIVEMRFFTGLSVEETAGVVGTSASTVKRDWKKARAFLYRELATGDEGESDKGESDEVTKVTSGVDGTELLSSRAKAKPKSRDLGGGDEAP